MLDKLFTSKTRVKLLTLFLLNPETEMYVRDITRRINENINAVRRELKNLEDIGLLSSERVGNLRYYKVNKKMPLFNELSNIILKTEGIGKILSEEIGGIGEIEVAFIYGSFARGEAGESSDIDLFIIGNAQEDELIRRIDEFETRFTRQINYVIFTPEEFKERVNNKDPFIQNVLDEEKVMLMGDLSGYK